MKNHGFDVISTQFWGFWATSWCEVKLKFDSACQSCSTRSEGSIDILLYYRCHVVVEIWMVLYWYLSYSGQVWADFDSWRT